MPEGWEGRVRKMTEALGCNNPQLLKNALEVAACIGHRVGDTGTLEIEAGIGVQDSTSEGLHLPNFEAQCILTALDRGRTEWAKRDDQWRIVHDTFVEIPSESPGGRCSSSQARIRSENGVPGGAVTKLRIARVDFACQDDSSLKLRLNSRIERGMENVARKGFVLLEPFLVRVSTVRTFEIDSKTMNGVTYRYTIAKTWSGRTVAEAEKLMHRETSEGGEVLGVNTVEVEVELSSATVEPETVVFACLGVLVKTQELLELIHDSKTVKKISLRSFKPNEQSKTPVKKRALAKRSVRVTLDVHT